MTINRQVTTSKIAQAQSFCDEYINDPDKLAQFYKSMSLAMNEEGNFIIALIKYDERLVPFFVTKLTSIRDNGSARTDECQEKIKKIGVFLSEHDSNPTAQQLSEFLSHNKKIRIVDNNKNIFIAQLPSEVRLSFFLFLEKYKNYRMLVSYVCIRFFNIYAGLDSAFLSQKEGYFPSWKLPESALFEFALNARDEPSQVVSINDIISAKNGTLVTSAQYGKLLKQYVFKKASGKHKLWWRGVFENDTLLKILNEDPAVESYIKKEREILNKIINSCVRHDMVKQPLAVLEAIHDILNDENISPDKKFKILDSLNLGPYKRTEQEYEVSDNVIKKYIAKKQLEEKEVATFAGALVVKELPPRIKANIYRKMFICMLILDRQNEAANFSTYLANIFMENGVYGQHSENVLSRDISKSLSQKKICPLPVAMHLWSADKIHVLLDYFNSEELNNIQKALIMVRLGVFVFPKNMSANITQMRAIEADKRKLDGSSFEQNEHTNEYIKEFKIIVDEISKLDVEKEDFVEYVKNNFRELLLLNLLWSHKFAFFNGKSIDDLKIFYRILNASIYISPECLKKFKQCGCYPDIKSFSTLASTLTLLNLADENKQKIIEIISARTDKQVQYAFQLAFGIQIDLDAIQSFQQSMGYEIIEDIPPAPAPALDPVFQSQAVVIQDEDMGVVRESSIDSSLAEREYAGHFNSESVSETLLPKDTAYEVSSKASFDSIWSFDESGLSIDDLVESDSDSESDSDDECSVLPRKRSCKDREQIKEGSTLQIQPLPKKPRIVQQLIISEVAKPSDQQESQSSQYMEVDVSSTASHAQSTEFSLQVRVNSTNISAAASQTFFSSVNDLRHGDLLFELLKTMQLKEDDNGKAYAIKVKRREPDAAWVELPVGSKKVEFKIKKDAFSILEKQLRFVLIYLAAYNNLPDGVDKERVAEILRKCLHINYHVDQLCGLIKQYYDMREIAAMAEIYQLKLHNYLMDGSHNVSLFPINQYYSVNNCVNVHKKIPALNTSDEYGMVVELEWIILQFIHVYKDKSEMRP